MCYYQMHALLWYFVFYSERLLAFRKIPFHSVLKHMLFLNRSFKCSVVIAMDFGVFVKIPCLDLFLESSVIKEMIIYTVSFASAWFTCRSSDDPGEVWFFSQHPITQGCLATTCRARDNYEKTSL